MNPHKIEAFTEEEEMYKENILDHYKHPHNKKKIAATVEHQEVNTLCGDKITVYLLIQKGKIVDAAFEGEGCAISQAAISLLTDEIKHKRLIEVKKVKKETILALLGVPISHTRMKCALLSLKAVEKGVEQYEKLTN